MGHSNNDELPQENKHNEIRVPSVWIVGAPGSGRGTIASALGKSHGFCVASATALLSSKLGQASSRGSIDVAQSLDDFLDENPDCAKRGFVLHGIPRNADHAEQLLSRTRHHPNTVIHVEAHENTLHERLGRSQILTLYHFCTIVFTTDVVSAGRLIHPASGRRYHKDFAPPKKKLVDDVSGERLVQYEQDCVEHERNIRISRYMNDEEALLTSISQKVPISRVDGQRSIDIVCREVKELVDEALGL